jgi:hypothetical protein
MQMNRLLLGAGLCHPLVAAVVLCWGGALPARAGAFTVYTDRAAFLAALGITGNLDNFSGYSAGPIPNAALLGSFYYAFDPSRTMPAIAAAGVGTNILGGAPYGVFVGGDQLAWDFNQSGGASPLTAFGATISYAPAAATIPANTFVLTAQGGPADGQTVGNPSLDNGGGAFFLGVIASAEVSFKGFALSAVQQDTNTLVPALQVNELIYHGGTIPVPTLTSLVRSGNTVQILGAGGLAGGRFYLLSSTNLSLPLSQWSTASTNVFDSSGAFSLLRAYNPTNRLTFFSLLAQ